MLLSSPSPSKNCWHSPACIPPCYINQSAACPRSENKIQNKNESQIQFKLTFFSAIDCGDPGTPTNGRKQGENYGYNSVVFFECDGNFELRGSASIRCNEDAEWTEDIPQCVGRWEFMYGQ